MFIALLLLSRRSLSLQVEQTFEKDLNMKGDVLRAAVAAVGASDEAMLKFMQAFEFGFTEVCVTARIGCSWPRRACVWMHSSRVCTVRAH